MSNVPPPPAAPPPAPRKNILAEVWEEDRPLNKVIIGDIIRCFMICFGMTLISKSLLLVPGLEEHTAHVIEFVDHTILGATLIVFTLLLFAELMIIRLRRVKNLLAEKS